MINFKFFKTIPTLGILVLTLTLLVSTVDAQVIYKHRMDGQKFQAEFEKWGKKKYQLVQLEIHSYKKRVNYAGKWEKRDNKGWTARHGMTHLDFQKAFEDLNKQGFRIIDLCGYRVGNGSRYAAIWEKKNVPQRIVHHGMSHKAYQQKINDYWKKGFRPVIIDGHGVGGRSYYSVVWEKRPGSKWSANHGLTGERFQEKFNSNKKRNYAPTKISGYYVDGERKFMAIWEPTNGKTVYTKHNINSSKYTAEIHNMYNLGYDLIDMTAYSRGNGVRYAASWIDKNELWKKEDLAFINATVGTFLVTSKMPGCAIAISKNGKLVFSKSFGQSDIDKKQYAKPRDLFRIASVSKPITAVAILKLIEDGKLKLNQKVFGPEGILSKDYPYSYNRPKIRDIEIIHLLQHTAGGPAWDNSSKDGTKDPMFQSQKATHQRLISLILGNRPPTFTPGDRYAYSNFGYCILGRVIEKVTGQSYGSYVKNSILKPMGITDAHIAGNTKSTRKPNEVTYYGRNAYEHNIKRMDSHGGWIASAQDLVRFALHVDDHSTVRDFLKASSIKDMTTGSSARMSYGLGWGLGRDSWNHDGKLSGSGALLMRTNNGYCYAVLFNGTAPQGTGMMMGNLINGVKKWPSVDLFKSNEKQKVKKIRLRKRK